MNPIVMLGLVLISIAAVVICVVYSLWLVLHRVLTKRLDPILFREPYFQRSELANYLVFPLSALRSFAYIYLIAAPHWAKKKRFKGFNESLPIAKSVQVACKVQFAMMFFGTVYFFIFFSFVGWAYFAL